MMKVVLSGLALCIFFCAFLVCIYFLLQHNAASVSALTFAHCEHIRRPLVIGIPLQESEQVHARRLAFLMRKVFACDTELVPLALDVAVAEMSEGTVDAVFGIDATTTGSTALSYGLAIRTDLLQSFSLQLRSFLQAARTWESVRGAPVTTVVRDDALTQFLLTGGSDIVRSYPTYVRMALEKSL
jgi:hypothetical protein